MCFRSFNSQLRSLFVLYYLGGRLTNPLPLGNYFISVITEIELLFYPSLSADEELQIRENYKLRLADAIVAATS
ncbi:hypothetical protein [Floridanema evergladense]|uniref:Uncharacterized protein n=1 Tax=Floridaenema evergladense BLCC-F167 TaxID=3153639 RepID=A0ABV4WT04_9CYAN